MTAFDGRGNEYDATIARVSKQGVTLNVGDPDAVSVGDYHLPNQVAWALAGEPRGDDARMLELLEPVSAAAAAPTKTAETAAS